MSVVDWKARTLRVEDEAIIPTGDTYRSPNGRRRVYLLVHGIGKCVKKLLKIRILCSLRWQL
jgi:hypothetical protein